MLWTLMALTAGCVPGVMDASPRGELDSAEQESAAPVDSWTAGDSELPTDSDPPADSGSASEGGTCMAGMVPVPAGAPVYCIDAYEVSGAGLSVAGVVPQVAVSFHQARDLCEATQVIGQGGAVIGYKRLATDAEWEDAGDGIPGSGGSALPYGDAPIDGICILPASDGSLVYSSLQPTGSAPGCLSSLGVYDQIGNAWEWVDPGQVVDQAAWLAEVAAGGFDVSVRDDGTLRSSELELPWLSYDGVVLAGLHPYADPDGVLVIDGSSVTIPKDVFLGGYLLNEKALGNLADAYLPVRLTDLGGSQFLLSVGDDGSPFTSKRGCAYYAGNLAQCTLNVISHEHPPEFTGTIGFRCTSDPIPAGA